MRFGTWNFRSLYRAGLLKTGASELVMHNFNIVAVQEVRWVESGVQPANNYTFLWKWER